MNKLRRTQINDLAEAIREACGIETPASMDSAVRCLGGRIEYVSNCDYEAKIEKEDEGFVITLDEETSEARTRFTLAHELGHLFLHLGFLDDEQWSTASDYTDSVYYRFGHTLEEYEAHEFAGAFLMPRAEFTSIAKQHESDGVVKLEPIAEHFGVSTQAALTRGRWLELFSWG